MKDYDLIFLVVVIFFIILILWAVSVSCYLERRTYSTSHQFNAANIGNINHRSIDSGFGKLYIFNLNHFHFIFYNCLIFFFRRLMKKPM